MRHCCYLFNDVGHNGVTAVCLRFWLRCIIFICSKCTDDSLVRFKLLTMLPFTLPNGALPLVCRPTFVATHDIWLLFSSCLFFCPRPPLSLPCSSSSRYCSSPALKKSEKRELDGRIQGLPNFLATPILYEERVKLRTSKFVRTFNEPLATIDHEKLCKK